MRGIIKTLFLVAGLVSSPYIALASKVVVDPGHGGSDPGAVGVNGLYEKNVNLEVAEQLKDLLLKKGYEVVMTRESDKTLSLQQRVDISKSSDADLFVSIHSNSHPSSSVRGTMVLYHDERHPNPDYPASEEMKRLTPESRRLAQMVLDATLEAVPNVNRGLVESSAYVVRMGNIPSILVELAFLSNGQDAKLLESSSIRHKYAEGIANGIARYLPPVFSDIGGHWAKDSIIRLNSEGIAQGSNGKFYPNNKLTRAELVAFIDKAFRLKGEVTPLSVEKAVHNDSVTDQVYGDVSDTDTDTGTDTGADSIPHPVFTDLDESHWSYQSMIAAIKSGVIRGYPDGTIRPNQPVTRAEVAAVLSRLPGTPDGSAEEEGISSPVFTDVSDRYWAYGAIKQLSVQGIVRGLDEGVFGPDRLVTRAEMAVMVDRRLSLTTRAEIVASETNKTNS